MDTAELVITAQHYGCDDLAYDVLGIADSVIFGRAPVSDAADALQDIAAHLQDIIETVEQAKNTPPNEEDLAAKNPYFCKSCE